MTTRIISSLIGLPLIALFIMLGGIYLKIIILAVILIALSEIYHAFSKKNLMVHWIGYIFACIYMLFADQLTKPHVLFFILCSFIICSFVALVFFIDKVSIIDVSLMIFGFFYVTTLMSTIYLVREKPYGQFFVWLSFIAAWGCDTGAYFTGRAFGRHKLAPKLSPKKTIEGSIGGVIVATLLAVCYALAVSKFSSIRDINIIGFCAVSGFIGSILAQIGDLTASAIKRYTGVKDYGNIIPGHGGVMDRFDSVLFTAPAIYIVMVVMLKV